MLLASAPASAHTGSNSTERRSCAAARSKTVAIQKGACPRCAIRIVVAGSTRPYAGECHPRPLGWSACSTSICPCGANILTLRDADSITDRSISVGRQRGCTCQCATAAWAPAPPRLEEHTTELESPYVITYAVFC